MSKKKNRNVPPSINWDRLMEKLMEKFPNLTKRDLDFKEGEMDEMLTKLQIKLGKTKKELFVLFSAL